MAGMDVVSMAWWRPRALGARSWPRSSAVRSRLGGEALRGARRRGQLGVARVASRHGEAFLAAVERVCGEVEDTSRLDKDGCGVVVEHGERDVTASGPRRGRGHGRVGARRPGCGEVDDAGEVVVLGLGGVAVRRQSGVHGKLGATLGSASRRLGSVVASAWPSMVASPRDVAVAEDAGASVAWRSSEARARRGAASTTAGARGKVVVGYLEAEGEDGAAAPIYSGDG